VESTQGSLILSACRHQSTQPSGAGRRSGEANALSRIAFRLASVTPAVSGPGGSASATIGYIHDANGALTFDGRNRYAYDAEGRLSSSAPATGEQAR
jgi:YD repeat-containing protein